MTKVFETVGWARIDISTPALDDVEKQAVSLGIPVETFDITPFIAGFRTFVELPQYSSAYRDHDGTEFPSFQEKALEHYLSLALAAPQPSQVAIDIGSGNSAVPDILRKIYRVRCYEQDLAYPPGISGDRIGSSAESIPLPGASVDFVTLHCAFEHFEGNADTGFVRECARLLKPGGRAVILPLYLNATHCNVTGESDSNVLGSISFDPEVQHLCSIPEWQNRFGRHYSPSALRTRIIEPARAAGLQPRLLRCLAWDQINALLWLRWIMVLDKSAPSDVLPATAGETAPQRTVVAVNRFAPPGHFYSPHPLIEDLEANYPTTEANSRRSPHLDLNVAEQLSLLAQVATRRPVGPWAPQAEPARRYYYDNSFFRFGDGNAIWHIAQLFSPQRVIEVGSGFSTSCWLDTFDTLGLSTELTCIEPYPDRVHQLCRPEDLKHRIDLRQMPVQKIPEEVFRKLAANDVLFIDSTHVTKSGSDVNYLFFQILPLLAPGVIVHIHDIFWPFEYPLSWYQEGRAWNECFLLRAFLQYNASFRIIRFNSYLADQHPQEIGRLDPRFTSDAGGSIWLRKVE